jgi:hypothetical protein
MKTQNYINHIALVLDMSASMHGVARDLIKVADAEIAHLARRSQELDQETRVTVYTFNHDVQCVIYDKDVLRLPSIRDFYTPNGMTALINATLKSQDDLEKTAQLYGDHAFLTYVLTDGQENASHHALGVTGGWGLGALRDQLTAKIAELPENWTVACLVPDQNGKFEAKRFGFPTDNIAVWDATTREGVEETFSTTIRSATETFMTNRTRGIRGSKTIFAGGDADVNTKNIKATMGFKQLAKDTYELFDVKDNYDLAIRPYVAYATGYPYRTGSAYYELMKTEKIQPQKEILVRNRKSGRVYSGADSRRLLGLPDYEVRVKPEENAEFQIFVQSTSVNRKLVAGTKLLVLK